MDPVAGDSGSAVRSESLVGSGRDLKTARASTQPRKKLAQLQQGTYAFISPPDHDSKKGRRPCSHWLDSSQGSSSTQLPLLHPDSRFGYPVVPRCAHLPVYNVESDFKHGTSPILPNHHLPLHNRIQHPPLHQLPLQRPLQLHKMPLKPPLQKMSQPTSPQQRKVAEWQLQNASPT